MSTRTPHLENLAELMTRLYEDEATEHSSRPIVYQGTGDHRATCLYEDSGLLVALVKIGHVLPAVISALGCHAPTLLNAGQKKWLYRLIEQGNQPKASYAAAWRTSNLRAWAEQIQPEAPFWIWDPFAGTTIRTLARYTSEHGLVLDLPRSVMHGAVNAVQGELRRILGIY